MNDPYSLVMDAIDRYHLHDGGAPVNLSPLEIICPITYEDLSRHGLAGFCIASEPASRERPAHVVVCRTLDDDQRRLTYAHEAAHGIIGHSGAMTLQEMDPWFLGQQEREAWQGAAMLLIPPLDQVQLVDSTMDSLAAACHVPRWLLDLYP